ncbi:MAG: SufD family Fe-S cluster assembly protein [bacterium]|nr:SufD family Fe-S cluster assembly protein [bacterium]
MHDLEMKKRAQAALDKPAQYGPDVDLSRFTLIAPQESYQEDLSQLPAELSRQVLSAGIETGEKGRSGTYFQKNHSVIHCQIHQEGVEILTIDQALAKYDWLKDYYWKMIPPDQDKYTAWAYLNPHHGYFIRTRPGVKTLFPVQACLYMEQDNLVQNIHNIIIAEEESELDIITGCAARPRMRQGLHVGVSEFYIKKGARLTFTMIHNWAEEMDVRPRSAASVGPSGIFISNYVSMKPIHSLQMYPTTWLEGKDSLARYYNILVASRGSELDVGSRVILKAEGGRAEVVSRAISAGGNIRARGCLVGKEKDIKAHLECRGLILERGGMIQAIPELEGYLPGIDLSHEAAVGKIAQEEINYLMARGLPESEAIAAIVRGFLTVDIAGLPTELQAELNRVVEESEKTLL